MLNSDKADKTHVINLFNTRISTDGAFAGFLGDGAFLVTCVDKANPLYIWVGVLTIDYNNTYYKGVICSHAISLTAINSIGTLVFEGSPSGEYIATAWRIG